MSSKNPKKINEDGTVAHTRDLHTHRWASQLMAVNQGCVGALERAYKPKKASLSCLRASANEFDFFDFFYRAFWNALFEVKILIFVAGL